MTPSLEHIGVARHSIRQVVLYDVTEDELDALERETSSISEDFSFGSIALTVAVSFTITLLTTKVPSDRTYLTFLTFVIIGYVAAVYFGIRWWRGRGTRSQIISRIKSRVGPLGQEGKELKPNELAALPAEEAVIGGGNQ